MSNITNLNRAIAELENKISRLTDFYKKQAETLEANRDSDNYGALQKQSYIEEEALTKELGGSIETFLNKEKEIIENALNDIESNIDKHTKTATQLISDSYEEQKKFIEEYVKDEKRKNELLLGLRKEFDKKMIGQYKKTLAGENQTVFEKLNERFEEEKQLYKEGSEEAIAIEKAYNKKRRELLLQQSKQLVNAISNLVNAAEAQLKEVEDTWGVTNQAAHEYGRAVGYNADQIKKLHDETLSWMSDNDISKQFNIGVDEMFKLMGAYNKEMGRAVALTNDSMLNLVSMKNVLGEEQALKFTANLDKFGLDVDAAKELVEGVVGDARRSGIVLTSLTQNVADNLHLAQQYTFEDGVEGLVRMAEKASAVKWNMEQTAAFAEKVSNVEGAIKTGAQLSVLGGPFAQFSNPMGMLYESLNDMEGLQDRIFAMFGNLGEWNQEKGMLDVSVFNKQRIKAAAAAMGLNYSDVMNTVQSQSRRNVVMDQIKGLGFGENATELIANTGQIDRETGRAYVNYDGKKIYADEINRNKDKDKILKYLEKQANSQDENLRDIAHNTLGAKELIEAVEKEFISDRADFFRSIGVSKEGLAETHEKIMYVKWGLDKVNAVLDIILGVIQGIAAVAAFRGAFGGGGAGAAGTGVPGSATPVNTAATGVWGRAKNAASGAWNKTKTAAGNFVKNGGAAMTFAVASNIGAGYMNAQEDRLRAKGLHEDADNVNLGSGALSWAGNGAALGSMFGPWGALAGGAIGGLLGLGFAFDENVALERERGIQQAQELSQQKQEEQFIKANEDFSNFFNQNVNGTYTIEEINRLRNGKSRYGPMEYKLLEDRGDSHLIDDIPYDSFYKGGVLHGPSHSEGGMNVINNQTGQIIAELEGNEGIIPKNVMEKFGTTDNLINNAMRPLQPINETIKTDLNKNGVLSSSLNVGGSANVNVGGTIQLSMPNGQTYNIANDPSAMKLIGDNVMKHIMMANQQMFNKTEFYRKW